MTAFLWSGYSHNASASQEGQLKPKPPKWSWQRRKNLIKHVRKMRIIQDKDVRRGGRAAAGLEIMLKSKNKMSPACVQSLSKSWRMPGTSNPFPSKHSCPLRHSLLTVQAEDMLYVPESRTQKYRIIKVTEGSRCVILWGVTKTGTQTPHRIIIKRIFGGLGVFEDRFYYSEGKGVVTFSSNIWTKTGLRRYFKCVV